MTNKDNHVLRVSDAVSLRDHIRDLLAEVDKRYEQRFTSQEEATKAALCSAQLAVDKAEANAEKWRANANEWRGAMTDREREFFSRTEANSRFKTIDETLNELKTLRDMAAGKASQLTVLISAAVAVIGLIIGLVNLLR